MKAVVINGPGELRIVDKPKPRPGRGEVLVRVAYCGICGSDLHAFETGFLPPGLTVGHEFSGIVAETGPGCEPWSEGERVTGNNIIACGECSFCHRGKENLCPEMRRLGVTDHGAMAEYVLVPASCLFAIPDKISLELATLAEPLSVALHTVNKVGLDSGKKAVIIGAGTIGLIVLALLRQRGLEAIAVIEPDPKRAAVAAAMGAAILIDPTKQNPDNEVSRFSGGCGADLVFECAGTPATIQEACSLAAAGAPVVVLSICHQPVEINFLGLVTREIEIKPAFGKTAAEFAAAVRLIASEAVDLSSLISDIIPLEAAEKGFHSSGGEQIKILVTPAPIS